MINRTAVKVDYKGSPLSQPFPDNPKTAYGYRLSVVIASPSLAGQSVIVR
ncbi:hypothetical protein SAMN04490178_12017 [Propionispora vibrioides]|uniref:Uncharacterized protein n=1 Tax=Propionispora vibrioides TaxID=112903 RepID=A0A1H8X4G0_9FIRM|nr:hypothetical protein SAMN04490178_12017 [Propionispora vibrioides]